MIQPDDIQRKALRLWTSKELLRDWIEPRGLFPFNIPAGSPNGRQIGEQYGSIRDWIANLESHAAGRYRITYREVNHRQYGAQRLPSEIVFESQEACLRLIGKQRQFERFKALAETTLSAWPALRPVLMRRPLDVLDAAPDWDRCLAVCRYFIEHPGCGLYLRQLDIPGVDSKFIERHRGLIAELLDVVLPASAVIGDIAGTTAKGFAQRFGLRIEPPSIRFRVLDAAGAIGSLRDLTVPLPELARLNPDIDTVFITENKTNGLCFPDVGRAIVIFGLGYGIDSLKEVKWLTNKAIYYWADIDTHGFRMLDLLRSWYPQTKSILMGEDTLRPYLPLCVKESDATRFTGKLDHLDESEYRVYTALLENRFGENLRLEQERIGFSHVESVLKRIGSC